MSASDGLVVFKWVSALGWKFITSPDQAPNQEVHLGCFKPKFHLLGTAQALHLRRESHPARFAPKREKSHSPSPPGTRDTVTRGAWHCSLSIPAQMAQLNLLGGRTPRHRRLHQCLLPRCPEHSWLVSPLLPTPQETAQHPWSPGHQRGPSVRGALAHWSALFESRHENFSFIRIIILPPPPLQPSKSSFPASLLLLPAASPFSPWNFPAAAELARQSGVLEKYIFGLICHA